MKGALTLVPGVAILPTDEAALAVSSPPPSAAPASAHALVQIRERYLRALLDRNSARARGAIEQALRAGTPATALIRAVVEPALVQVGRLWETGAINVAHEHYASVVSQSVLSALADGMRSGPRDGRLAIVAGSPGEQHALGAHVVASFLEADGWEALCLGADVPSHDLVALAAEEGADLVALSTATPTQVPAALEALEALSALAPRPLVVAGGRGWAGTRPGRAVEAGADFLVPDPETLVALAREHRPPPGD